MFNKLLEVEVEMRRSQERDKKTIEKNQELLKIDEDDEVKQQYNLYKTQDNHYTKSKGTEKTSKKIAEVLSIGGDHTGTSYESQKYNSGKINEMNSFNIVQTMKHPSMKYESIKAIQKSGKKQVPKKSPEMIFLKKKTQKQPKGSNLNLIIGNNERDIKQIFKNNKAKSKYDKYINKQDKSKKVSYPTISDAKSTRNALFHHGSQERKMYELMT